MQISPDCHLPNKGEFQKGTLTVILSLGNVAVLNIWEHCYLFTLPLPAASAHALVWHGDARTPITSCHYPDMTAAMDNAGRPGRNIKSGQAYSNLSVQYPQWPYFHIKWNCGMKMKNLAWRKRKQAVKMLSKRLPFVCRRGRLFFQGHGTLLHNQVYRNCKRNCIAGSLIKCLWQLN